MPIIYKIIVKKDKTRTVPQVHYRAADEDDLNPFKALFLSGGGLTLKEYKYFPEAEFNLDATTADLALPENDEDDSKEYYLVVGPWSKANFQRFLNNEVLLDESIILLDEHTSPIVPRRRLTKESGRHFTLRGLLARPGLYSIATLALILTGIFVPVAAPGLILAAAITTGLTGVSLIPSIEDYLNELWWNNGTEVSENARGIGAFIELSVKKLKKWAVDHPAQAIIVFIAVGLLVTTLTLTIGFFTGGAGFAFMAPVFAAIAAPFATAAAAAAPAVAAALAAKVSLAALAGASFILAGLAIPDLFRRFAAWFDGFDDDKPALPLNVGHEDGAIESRGAPSQKTLLLPKEDNSNPISYMGQVFTNMGRELKVLTGFSTEQEELEIQQAKKLKTD